jgi:ABC-2 type transport system ATP-binding protein
VTWGLAQVTVVYRSVRALDGVDIPVDPGRVTVLVGGDGAGKSTAAKTLVGLVEPTSGRVRRPEKRRVGYQSEQSGVWSDLTVSENLRFVARAHGIPQPDARIDHLLEVTGLRSARDRLAGRLSGGMRQKLGVAMALLPEPRLLVLDEPTTGLDPISRTDLWMLVADAAADGTAVLLTTTYTDEAERGSLVVALDQGRVLAAGTVEDLVSRVPGRIVETDRPDGIAHRWRRGSRWRGWLPDGHPPPEASVVRPDLADVLIVASLLRRADASAA